jgi:sporulation protein YlmC with PRC-barrel domain
MRRLASAFALATVLSNAALAQQGHVQVLSSVPGDAFTVTDYYKQNVYDPSDNKIGDIKDVLIDKSGQVKALIVGVGGFVGVGEKDVAVPFDAIKSTTKDNKTYLVMNANRDELKNAAGFTYDRSSTKWVPEKK